MSRLESRLDGRHCCYGKALVGCEGRGGAGLWVWFLGGGGVRRDRPGEGAEGEEARIKRGEELQ